MNKIYIDALMALALPVILCVAYALSFNERFSAWREGRHTWREIGRLRKREHA